MGSAGDISAELSRERANLLAAELAQAIVDEQAALITGETSGLPSSVLREVRQRNGLCIGISPAHNEDEQRERFSSPELASDVVIYTGFGMKGRNVLNIRSSDIVVIFGGSIGTLNEFTIAYDEGKVIAVIESSGGVADLIRDLLSRLTKKTKATVLFGTNPRELLREAAGLFVEEASS